MKSPKKYQRLGLTIAQGKNIARGRREGNMSDGMYQSTWKYTDWCPVWYLENISGQYLMTSQYPVNICSVFFTSQYLNILRIRQSIALGPNVIVKMYMDTVYKYCMPYS